MEGLGVRMKKYEYITRTHLIPRMPVIIRVDGRSFHTFTRGFRRPFDAVLISAMQQTMLRLCEEVQGCVLGYTQSDEISLVLVDYKKLNSASWFDYNIQKCVSVAAGMSTLYFNQAFHYYAGEVYTDWYANGVDDGGEECQYLDTLSSAMHCGAMFDARAFNLPKEEVCNYLYWRQIDARRNSIQMVGQHYFGHKSLLYKSSNDIQEMLFSRKGINWNDLPTYQKRGSCCIRQSQVQEVERRHWIIDRDIPMFTGDGRHYVDSLITFTEE